MCLNISRWKGVQIIAERSDYEVIIVGAGSMGMSAGYHLARRGVKTLLIDAFDPPHTEGSHHGETRLIRHAYSGDPAYIDLALRAQVLWEEAETESGLKLLAPSGVLNLADSRVYSFAGRHAEAQKRKVRTEQLDAAEIRRRWPALNLRNPSRRCMSRMPVTSIVSGALPLTGSLRWLTVRSC